MEQNLVPPRVVLHSDSWNGHASHKTVNNYEYSSKMGVWIWNLPGKNMWKTVMAQGSKSYEVFKWCTE